MPKPPERQEGRPSTRPSQEEDPQQGPPGILAWYHQTPPEPAGCTREGKFGDVGHLGKGKTGAEERSLHL